MQPQCKIIPSNEEIIKNSIKNIPITLSRTVIVQFHGIQIKKGKQTNFSIHIFLFNKSAYKNASISKNTEKNAEVYLLILHKGVYLI